MGNCRIALMWQHNSWVIYWEIAGLQDQGSITVHQRGLVRNCKIERMGLHYSLSREKLVRNCTINWLTVHKNSLVINYRIERIGWHYSLSKNVQRNSRIARVWLHCNSLINSSLINKYKTATMGLPNGSSKKGAENGLKE